MQCRLLHQRNQVRRSQRTRSPASGNLAECSQRSREVEFIKMHFKSLNIALLSQWKLSGALSLHAMHHLRIRGLQAVPHCRREILALMQCDRARWLTHWLFLSGRVSQSSHVVPLLTLEAIRSNPLCQWKRKGMQNYAKKRILVDDLTP